MRHAADGVLLSSVSRDIIKGEPVYYCYPVYPAATA